MTEQILAATGCAAWMTSFANSPNISRLRSALEPCARNSASLPRATSSLVPPRRRPATTARVPRDCHVCNREADVYAVARRKPEVIAASLVPRTNPLRPPRGARGLRPVVFYKEHTWIIGRFDRARMKRPLIPRRLRHGRAGRR